MEDEDDEEEGNEFMLCKVVLLGEQGVGKTSIITRYISNKFSEFILSTSTASYATKKLELDKNQKIKFQIWDTAGQEKFRSLAKIFYQNASTIILVYDITERNSFEKLKEYWVKEIKNNAPNDIIIAFVGNKSDNYEAEVVSIDEGKELAKELNAIFKLTSAKLGIGINELFENIAKKFIDPSLIFNESNKESFQEKKSLKISKNKNKKNKNKKKVNKCC